MFVRSTDAHCGVRLYTWVVARGTTRRYKVWMPFGHRRMAAKKMLGDGGWEWPANGGWLVTWFGGSEQLRFGVARSGPGSWTEL